MDEDNQDNIILENIYKLAALIRSVDPRHDLGAAALAEELVSQGVRVTQ